MKAKSSLLAGTPGVINIGLLGFATDLAARGVPVAHVDWRPPRKGGAAGRGRPKRLLGWLARHEARIAKANAEGLRRMLAANPVLVDVQPAGKVIAGLGDRVLLHSGPPIEWRRMCGPMQGAVAGAIVFAGWAASLKAAAELA